MGTRSQLGKASLMDATLGTAIGTNPNDVTAVRDFLGLQSVGATYHDQLPPFNVTISAANEYGHVCRMVIKNVEIMNAGSGMSIDDITTDESCTFVATEVIPWSNQANVRFNVPIDNTNNPTTT